MVYERDVYLLSGKTYSFSSARNTFYLSIFSLQIFHSNDVALVQVNRVELIEFFAYHYRILYLYKCNKILLPSIENSLLGILELFLSWKLIRR